MRRLIYILFLGASALGLTSCGGTPAASTAITCTTTTSSTSTATSSSACMDPVTGISVSVSPATVSVNVVTTYQFSAGVGGSTNIVVTWSVNGVTGGSDATGHIDSNGLYHAPSAVPTGGGAVTVTATSFEDPNVSASSAVTITPPPTVTISPSTPVTLPSGSLSGSPTNTQTFVGTVTGAATTNVDYYVALPGGASIKGGNPILGTISSTGVYSPPLTPPVGSTVIVSAVSRDFPSALASDTVTIVGYSTPSLQGRFAFSISGRTALGPFYRAGSFVLDGAGNLSNGLEDVNDSLGVTPAPIAFTGTYMVGADGRGTLKFNDNRATTPAIFDFVIANSNQFQFIGFDATGTSAGQAVLQDASKFISSFAGTYVFDFAGVQGANPLSQIGEFTVDGAGNITGGLIDSNTGGTIASGVAITGGTYTGSLNSNGRGTATLVTSNGSLHFAFYLISQGQAKFVGTDSTQQVAGTVSQQAPNATFDNTILNGNYAFLLAGAASGGKIATAGSFLADGAGHFTSGVADENVNGSPIANLSFQPSGTYTVASSGRGTATFTTATRTYNLVFYIGPIGNGTLTAVAQETDSGITSDGIFAQQQSAAFALNSIQGNYAVSTSGGTSSPSAGQVIVGQFASNGSGVIPSGAMDINTGGVLTPGEAVTGTYTAPAANGRSTLVLNPTGDNRNFAAYVVNAAQVFILGIDPGRVAVGALYREF